MATQNEARVAEISLANARVCLQNKNYGRAFANFLLFLKLCPQRSQEVYFEFSLVTKEWCDELESGNRMKELVSCYDQALEMYPDHDVVLNNIGAQLFRLGFTDWAAWYIHRALVANPEYLAARDNLENVCSHLVERWHFPMLNDKSRNQSYRYAIHKAIGTGHNRVLDIGTGTGILSMMCALSGAKHVTACDQSPAMVEVAREVVAANEIRDQVTLIHKSSLDLRVPEDMPQKVKLVVTETFDACLFGEHIVSTLCHAWRNLISTMGTVIPSHATMYVSGIECEAIRTNNRLLYPALLHVDLSLVDLVSSVGRLPSEPYTTEDLASVRGGYRVLTNVKRLLQELEELNRGKDWACELEVKEAGHLDALAVWFDLYLDESVSLSTGPKVKSCWEQAIYPITSLKLPQSNTHGNYMVQRREKVHARFHFLQDCLRMEKCEVLSGGPYPKEKVTNRLQFVSKSLELPLRDLVTAKPWRMTSKQINDYYLPFRKRKVDIAGSMDDQVVSSSSIEGSGAMENNGGGPEVDAECTVSAEADHYGEPLANDTQNAQESCDSHAKSDDVYSDWTHADGVSNLFSDGTHKDAVCTKLGKGDCVFTQSVGDKLEYIIHYNTDKSVRSVDFSNTGTIYEATCSTDDPCKPEAGNCTNGDSDSCLALETTEIRYDQKENQSSKPDDVLANLSAITLEKSPTISPPGSQAECNMQNPTTRTEMNATDSGKSVKCDDKSQMGSVQKKVTCLAEMVDIQYINDIYFNTQLCHSITQYRHDQGSRELSLLCITPRLSFLAIQAVKIGYQSVTMAAPVEHHQTVRQVAELNGCESGTITLVDLDEFKYPEKPVDVIVCDVVEPCGALRQQILENVSFYRIGSLTDGGIILPGEVKVHGLFIESEDLERHNRVMSDDHTLSLSIAEHINVFQVQNHINIDLTVLPHEILSESFELFNVVMANITADNSTSILHQSMERSIRIIHPGRVTALVYWFELSFYGGVVVSTLDTRCHWKQASVILKNKVEVDIGQTFVAKVMLQNSCLDVKIVQSEKRKKSRKS